MFSLRFSLALAIATLVYIPRFAKTKIVVRQKYQPASKAIKMTDLRFRNLSN